MKPGKITKTRRRPARSAAVDTQCTAVLQKGTDAATCGVHGVSLVRKRFELVPGKPIEYWRCPQDENGRAL